MFEQLTNPVFIIILISGITEIAKKYEVPTWVLNVLPTTLAILLSFVQLLNPDQIEVFNNIMLSNSIIGISTTLGYKILSGIAKKTKVDQGDISDIVFDTIKAYKRK